MNEIAAQELLQHNDFVRRLARALCADEHGAEDLVQETWLTALTRERPDASSLRGWLAGVARHLASQGRRGSTRRTAREAAAASEEGQPSTDELVARMETHRRVVSAVLELPPSARQAIVLRYFDALPPRTIAAQLGLPVETVRTRVKRARERLREELAEEHGSHRALLLALGKLANPGAPGGTLAPVATTAATALLPALGSIGVAALAVLVGVAAWPSSAAEPAGPGELAQEAQSLLESNGALDSDPTLAHSDTSRRPASQAAAENLVEIDRTAALVIRDVNGSELHAESGELYLRAIDGTPREARLVLLEAGRFSLAGVPAGIVQIERATVGSGFDKRPIAFENAQFELEEGEPPTLRGFFLRDASLRVIDARSGAPLDQVRVLVGHGGSNQAHPGPHFPASFAVLDKPSPVRLPRVRWQQGYWVTAKDHSWSFIEVDHEGGGERLVQLEPGGRLEVQLVGHDPGLALRLCVFPLGSTQMAASCALDQGGYQAFNGLPLGEYNVRAEIGAPGEPGRLLAEAPAVILAGGTTSVRLESFALPLPPPVDVQGELLLPPGYEELEITLRIRPAEGPRLRKQDVKRIPRGRMGNMDEPGLLSWDAETLSPGRYLFVVSPVQYGVLFDVPNAPVDDLRIELPPLHELVVRAADARSGAAVKDATLRWTRELPADAGPDAWIYSGLDPDLGSATLLVPAGQVFLAASSPTHAQAFLNAEVGAGPGELTLELPPLIALEVVLTDGDTRIPWGRDMTCSVRRVGSEPWHPCGSSNDGKQHVVVDEPGSYELSLGPLPGYVTPDPLVVSITEGTRPPVVVRLER